MELFARAWRGSARAVRVDVVGNLNLSTDSDQARTKHTTLGRVAHQDHRKRSWQSLGKLADAEIIFPVSRRLLLQRAESDGFAIWERHGARLAINTF
jgi:hypothetical protein